MPMKTIAKRGEFLFGFEPKCSRIEEESRASERTHTHKESEREKW